MYSEMFILMYWCLSLDCFNTLFTILAELVLYNTLNTHLCACCAITAVPDSISLKREFSVTKLFAATVSNSASSTSEIREIALQASLVIVDRRSNNCWLSGSATFARKVYICGIRRRSWVTKHAWMYYIAFRRLLQSFFILPRTSARFFPSISSYLAVVIVLFGF